MKPSHPIGSSTSAPVSRGCPKRHFGEYELFPSLISLSPLPTAHPRAFQRSPVRPSIRRYPDFSLAMGRSQGFASAPPDSTPSSDSPSLRLPPSRGLTSPDRTTRRLIIQKARRHQPRLTPTACRRTVSGSLSPRCSRCFSPFPHGTGSLSVFREYLALPDGPGRFGQGFPCPALLRVSPGTNPVARTGLSPPSAPLSSGFRFPVGTYFGTLLPRGGLNHPGLGYSPFARHYSGNHCCFLLLRVLRCFSSPGSPPASAGWQASSLPGCPIRTPSDLRPFAPPQGFSQLVASFFASGSPGIPRAPLITSPARNRASPRPAPLLSSLALLFLPLLVFPFHHHVKELLYV